MSIKSLLTDQIETLEAGAAEVVFRPTEEQRALKAAFYSRTADNPTIDPATFTLTDVKHVLKKGSSFEKHWNQPGFQEWFRNNSEHREKLEELFDIALDSARDILLSTEPKVQGARVQMIKAIAELANKYPRKAVDANPMLAAIGQMDKAQLQLFLQKNGVSLQMNASGEKKSQEAIPAEIVLDNGPKI